MQKVRDQNPPNLSPFKCVSQATSIKNPKLLLFEINKSIKNGTVRNPDSLN